MIQQINVIRPNAETIDIIKRLLERAESGEVQQILIATVNRERIVSTVLSNDLEIRDASFAVRILQVRVDDLIRTLDETN